MNNKISKTPFIKWTGSKRKQAPYIVDQFPKNINTILAIKLIAIILI